ncbi:aspartyl protease family protein At5g10770-like isoform X1 [Quercus robur]|uniref:aspartyl protease family protein At5g10770-like isoform X1 n=1 Tax=Quercus robur TaxID=38942 RepID=UPI0021636C8B|nr:aspartyl protease family protein At5g10770-like isoform X1 [Quercus robur]
MATRFSSFVRCILYIYSFFAFLCLQAYEARETTESYHLNHTHTVQVSSLLPSSTCTASTKGPKREASLTVKHKYGPCFQSNKDQLLVLNHTKLLLQDQSRVNSIHSMFSKNSDGNKLRESQATTIPAKSGLTIGFGNYIVTVGLGTPKTDQTLAFDTGSDLTWAQCKPCAGQCYKQVDPIFDPSRSTSYTNISCPTPLCTQLTSSTRGSPQRCSNSKCLYSVRYVDGSFTIGYFSKERLTITSDVVDNFVFGCGQDNEGLFQGIAGLLGLGRGQVSLVQQAAQKYSQFFSYCLPSTTSSTGYLTLGKGNGISSSLKFTPMLPLSRRQSFYGLNLIGISVGGQRLSIPTSVFSTAGTIIDSGTVITRLPPTAYNALRTKFREMMRNYPMISSSSSTFDTCYDLSKSQSVSIPSISFFFGGDVSVDLDKVGILYVLRKTEACLAFAGNRDPSNIAIFGNEQQKGLEVVYDVVGERIGFRPGGCS